MGIPPLYVTKPTLSTQPCIPPESLYWIPALICWGKGGNVTCAMCQVNCVIPYGTWVHVAVKLVANCYIQLLYSWLAKVLCDQCLKDISNTSMEKLSIHGKNIKPVLIIICIGYPQKRNDNGRNPTVQFRPLSHRNTGCFTQQTGHMKREIIWARGINVVILLRGILQLWNGQETSSLAIQASSAWFHNS